MIVLHVSLLGESLALWGEIPCSSAGPRAPARRSKKLSGLPVHPFCASSRALLALERGSIGFTPNKKRTEEAIAWLPSTERRPIPSSAILGEIPSNRKPLLRPWRIGVYTLTWREATGLVAQCSGKNVLAQGIIAGDELQFWSRVLRFAGSLAARQQFLPGLRTGTKSARNGRDGVHSGSDDARISRDGLRALWEPALVGEDALYAASLAETIPPVALAITHAKASSSQPSPDRRRALESAITGFVDYIVRSSAGIGNDRGERDRSPVRAAGNGTVHDAWLSALRAPDGQFRGNKAEIRRLVEGLGEWRRSIDTARASGSRLCFRLSEPAGPADGRWRLDYLVQSLDDRSVLLPLDSLWKNRTLPNILARHLGSGAKEHALASLAQAAGLSDPIRKSLRKSVPSGRALETAEANDFLRDTAVALKQAGFGVMLPAWWTRWGTKARLVAHGVVRSPLTAGSSGISFDALLDFRWEVALGGKSLTREELETLATLKAPLVKLRGEWVEVNPEVLNAAMERRDPARPERKSVSEVVRMELTRAGSYIGLPVEGISASGWVGDLLAKLRSHETFEELPPPSGFAGTLRPYQVRGYSWLAFPRQWGFGVCLADDMGLGKTVQLLALIQRDREAGIMTPVLVVCPMSVVNNWVKETERFAPGLPVMVHHGVDRRRGTELQHEAMRHALVVSTYALLQRDLAHFQAITWAGIVLDEAQNIKNPEAKQSRASHQLKAGYRVALTGTPVENNVGDLWSIFQFLNPGLLGSKAEFKKTYFLPIQTGQDQEAVDGLKRITGPFILRRLKTDRSIIADLPEKMEMKVYCPLTKEQASLYRSVLKVAEEQIAAAEGMARRGVILATLSKLKQVCNHPAHFLGDNSIIPGRSGKLARLGEMVEEVVASGDKALVFTQFTEMGSILKEHLQESFGTEVLFLHGGTPRARRDEMVERFQGSSGGPSLFVLSLKAGGTGLNLTAASHVFHFDRWWNPAVEQQATDRAFRIGQKKNVQVHKFVCGGTLEEKIDEMIERKKEIAEKVIGAGEGWLTELSNNELKNILTLRTDTAEEP